MGPKLVQAWQEAVEREVLIAGLHLGDLLTTTQQQPFTFPAGRALEPLRAPGGPVVGVLERRQQAISGTVEVAAAQVRGMCKLTVRIGNETALAAADLQRRDEAVLRAFVSTHTLLGVARARSSRCSIPPPPGARRPPPAATWAPGRCWSGEEGERDMMLSSPIILYDYPQIAPESPGDLFDGTEIDEILTLRILTLTDEEKQEDARGGRPRPGAARADRGAAARTDDAPAWGDAELAPAGGGAMTDWGDLTENYPRWN